MPKQLRVAVLEPYYGGSHAAFVDTFAAHSRHDCVVHTLPARKWKWRMRGAAAWFARDAAVWQGGDGQASDQAPDVVLCNDMLSVPDLRALAPPHARGIPIACYFHENQLTYPLPDETQRDYQYGMTNILSCLAADAVWFNSRFHRDEFLEAAATLLRKMPDFIPAGVVETVRGKSAVLAPPIDVESAPRRERSPSAPPTILWCHRWEYDKNPEPFFDALIRLDRSGAEFRLVLTGEQFRTQPDVFEDSWPRIQTHLDHAGFIADRTAYLDMLGRCDIVVSTAIQENFGIAAVEAILSGCQPLLPNRLAYPELLPRELHKTCLYASDTVLFEALHGVVTGKRLLPPEARSALAESLSARFGVRTAVAALDDALQTLASHEMRT